VNFRTGVRLPCKADAKLGRLPTFGPAGAVIDGLIRPFSLAFGRTPLSGAFECVTIGVSRGRWWWLRP
jgi:hypothetical protein